MSRRRVLSLLAVATAGCSFVVDSTGLSGAGVSDELDGSAADVTTDTAPPLDAGADGIDDGDAGGDSEAAASCSGTPSCERLVFVTRDTFPGATGGIVGGDAKCKLAANASSIASVRGRSWYSWMSSSNGSPTLRMVHGTKPYRRVDGTQVAADWNALVSGTLDAPLRIDENGTPITTVTVWTGTTDKGEETLGDPQLARCGGWSSTSDASTGRQGNANETDIRWSDDVAAQCPMVAHLYCFER